MNKSTSLAPFVCLDCRKSFKRPSRFGDVDQRPCPKCGAPAHRFNEKFKAPKRDEVREWEVVRFLFEHGFRYKSIRRNGEPIPYPRTLDEAKLFVTQYQSARL